MNDFLKVNLWCKWKKLFIDRFVCFGALLIWKEIVLYIQTRCKVFDLIKSIIIINE